MFAIGGEYKDDKKSMEDTKKLAPNTIILIFLL
jgi:hypothetical protein